ncbi:MAG: phospholipase [Bacteroidota bacterium]
MSNPQLHTLPVTRTARYATLGQLGPHVRQLWIVTHGYGQLAKTFIRRFLPILDDTTFVIAPEGLSRFYWGGFDGPVVASWMTREDRLDEIVDYSNMLDQLYAYHVAKCHPDVQINLLGFSQGTATQVRWIMRSLPRFHRLMLWAGQLPEDLDYSPQHDYFADKELFCAFGDQDPFVTPERLAMMRQIIATSGLSFTEIGYVGEHKVVKEALTEWWKKQVT